MSSVTLKNINKTYPDGFHAVRDVSVDIADGEFVVLVGPSGCGKSTTLRMIAGLEEISSGEISIGDRVVNRVEPGDRDIAMVFQNYALYPHMTVRQNMAFGLKMRKTPKPEIKQRVDEAAKMLAIEPLLDRRPRELSGGQRQRVALGRAIVRKPAAFLFDEPLSNLDAKLRGEMRTEISALHKRLGATMIYVTHDQVEAMTLGDRLVLMKDGVVQQEGTPLEVYNQPANRFAATFIGSPAMNLLEGEIKEGEFHVAGAGGAFTAEGFPEGEASLGVRPEHLLVSDNATKASAQIRNIEHLGHECLVHLQLGNQPCTARIASHAAASLGESVSLSIRAGAAHFFAADELGHRIG